VKVKANAIYRYNPVLLDQIDGRTSLQTGDLIRVVNLPGCPKANTMGHCHVADPTTDSFIGLVCCNSLEPLQRRFHRIRAVNMAKAILAGVGVDAGDFSLTVAHDAMDSIAVCPEVVRVDEIL
jgi:hypothetical protein